MRLKTLIQNKMLINNEVDLKEILGGVQQTITWETMGPFVKQAELEFIVPAIGEAFYDELIDTVNPSGLEEKLIDRLSIAVANYALAGALPQLVTVIGDAGAAMNNQGGAMMTKWMFVELKNGSMAKADKALEAALVWLEKNQDSFTTWKNSETCTISKSLLINDATELSEFFPSANGSRRLYLSMREYLKRVEKFDLPQRISEEFLTVLKGTSIDAKVKQAAVFAKYYVAHKGMSEALPFLNINEDFRMVANDQYSLTEGSYVLDAARRDALKVGLDEQAEEWLNKLMKYLDENASASVFVEYFNSSAYKVSNTNKGYFFKKNDPSKSYVRL